MTDSPPRQTNTQFVCLVIGEGRFPALVLTSRLSEGDTLALAFEIIERSNSATAPNIESRSVFIGESSPVKVSDSLTNSTRNTLAGEFPNGPAQVFEVASQTLWSAPHGMAARDYRRVERGSARPWCRWRQTSQEGLMAVAPVAATVLAAQSTRARSARQLVDIDQ